MTESLLNDIRVLRRENEWLREQLARSDQQIEWLSRENAALRRDAGEATAGLLELRTMTTEALAAVRERVARDAAEVEKWRERYHGLSTELAVVRDRSGKRLNTITSLELEIDQLKRNNEYLRGRIAFLEKVLNSKPGTVHFGREGFYLRGVDGEAT